jgi:hypothetical protein
VPATTTAASLAFSTVLPTTVHAAAALPSRMPTGLPFRALPVTATARPFTSMPAAPFAVGTFAATTPSDASKRMPPARATLALLPTTASCEPPGFTQMAGPGERKAA